MTILEVTDSEFITYGRVMEGYDISSVLEEMKKTPVPADVIYEASVAELEALPVFRELSDGIYGQMPIQMGYCNGHNRKLNALEYHRDSEINIAATDMILLLGRQQQITKDFTLDTDTVKAFRVPAGTMVEIYATTLHYAPCQTDEDGFRCVVVLPKGTNGYLEHAPAVRWGEEKLLAAVNKWLIGHAEGGLPEGSWIGLCGENITI